MADETAFPDVDWSDDEWRECLRRLLEQKVVTWKDVTTLTLGHLNPPQVGTAMASSEGFKKRYGKGNTMKVVMEWFYTQDGRCVDCGTRLELQQDHIKSKQEFADPLDADYIENMVIRCRRCNVIRRPSHVFGGQTHLTAESALMWILFTYWPRTPKDYIRLCRLYGMTMADIRMHEGWAMAVWLAQDPNVAYQIDGMDPDCLSSILLWEDDGAMTRCWTDDKDLPSLHRVLYHNVTSDQIVYFVAAGPHPSDSELSRVMAFQMPVADIPFSHYFEGEPQALAVRYVAPKRHTLPPTPAKLAPLPPRKMLLLASGLQQKPVDWKVVLYLPSGIDEISSVSSDSTRKKLLDLRVEEVDQVKVELHF